MFDNFKDYSDFYLKDKIETLTEADCLEHQKKFNKGSKNTINIPDLVASLGRFLRRHDDKRDLRIKESTLIKKLSTLQTNIAAKKLSKQKRQAAAGSLVFELKDVIKEKNKEKQDRKDDKIVLQKDYRVFSRNYFTYK